MEPIKIIKRLFALILILIGVNAFYTHFIWPDELRREAPDLLKLLRLQDSCDIMYFGESSNISYHPTKDSITTSISGLIAENLQNQTLGDITHPAYHMGLYLPLIKRIEKNSKVKTIVVTMNLRTFDQACIHSELETAMQKEALYYSDQWPVLIHLRAAISDYDHVSAFERDLNMWKQWTNDSLKVKGITFPYPTIKTWCEAEKFPLPEGGENMDKRMLADHNVKAFAFVMDDQNPRVKDADQIVKIAKAKGLKIIFNLLPENIEYADSLVGEPLVKLMKYNRDFLVNRYRNMGALVVDNLEIVEGKYFIDQHWTTEHYEYIGRKAIADRVGQAL